MEHKREKVLIQGTSFSFYSLQQVIFFDWGDFRYLNAIINVLFVTDTIENYELEDYIEEILFNEFDTMVEDGSLSKVRIE